VQAPLDRAAAATVLVVDDDASFRAFVRELLEGAGYGVVEAAGADEALNGIEPLPTLVVLDVAMSPTSGYEVCRVLRARRPTLPILFVSGEQTEVLDRVAGLTLGADDYLVKPFEPGELLARVHALLRRVVPQRSATSLTRRELEVLNLLADGFKQREIADRLVISPKTVGTHIEHVLSKLGVHSRAEAVAAAYRRDLIAS
jgi:DNA-binding NarL/FixJ family response regulator